MTLGIHRRLTGLLALAAALVAPLVARTGAAALAGAPSTIVIDWGTESSVVRGSQVTVTGTLLPNVEDRTVQLQRDVPGSAWATLSEKVVPATSGGSFSFTLPAPPRSRSPVTSTPSR